MEFAHSPEGEKPPEVLRADDSYPDQCDSVGVFLCPNAVSGLTTAPILLLKVADRIRAT